MTKEQLFEQMKGTVIVSCQAVPGEPLYLEDGSVMYLMARAAKRAGARVIRTSSVRDVVQIKRETALPVIGLIKREYPGYAGRITLTLKEVEQLKDAGADIVAMDMTDCPRGDGLSAPEFLRRVRALYPELVLMADISTRAEGVEAWRAGADLVGTTMSGYTPHSRRLEGPDFELVCELVDAVPIPVVAEGRVHTPEQARKALELGAHAVVVGGAITRPYEIAKRFVDGVK